MPGCSAAVHRPAFARTARVDDRTFGVSADVLPPFDQLGPRLRRAADGSGPGGEHGSGRRGDVAELGECPVDSVQASVQPVARRARSARASWRNSLVRSCRSGLRLTSSRWQRPIPSGPRCRGSPSQVRPCSTCPAASSTASRPNTRQASGGPVEPADLVQRMRTRRADRLGNRIGRAIPPRPARAMPPEFRLPVPIRPAHSASATASQAVPSCPLRASTSPTASAAPRSWWRCPDGCHCSDARASSSGSSSSGPAARAWHRRGARDGAAGPAPSSPVRLVQRRSSPGGRAGRRCPASATARSRRRPPAGASAVTVPPAQRLPCG